MQTCNNRLIVAVSVLALVSVAVHRASAQCPADISGNGSVTGEDLAAVLASWGSDGSDEPSADVNSDGSVDGADLASVLGAFGPCITVPSWATLIEAQPDPAVVWDEDLRAAITATGLAWRVRDTATQIEMMLIPPGTFNMGEDGWAGPVHQVTLTNAFYLGRHEVTQAQWQARMGSNPSYFQAASEQVPAAQVPNRPVEQVSWNMIAGAGGFMAQAGMRLPTEAEWEYAYRAGTTTAYHGFSGYPSGTNEGSLLPYIAWHAPNSNEQTRPVGGLAGNGLGLFDMSGNVDEWMSDFYSPFFSPDPQTDPTGPTEGSRRVTRSGSWARITLDVRCTQRYSSEADATSNSLGCRAARNP